MPLRSRRLLPKPKPKPAPTNSTATEYTRAGRPIRKSGVLKANSPFIDSATAISDGSDSEDDTSSLDEGIIVKSRKRKRSPSPDLSLASFSHHGGNDLTDIDSDGPDESLPASSETAPLQVVLNVPSGPARQVILNVDISGLVGRQDSKPLTPLDSRPAKELCAEKPLLLAKKKNKSKAALLISSAVDEERAGFLDLPAELRNEIYRLAFLRDEALDFGSPPRRVGLQLSSAFLSTCRQVHEEGRTILYSENEFFFNRRSVRHGSLWSSDWSELGFIPVRTFLKVIGPTNLSLIRYVSFHFDDAQPCLNPQFQNAEDRRFVYDAVLLSALRQLERFGRLKTLHISLQGRKTIDHYYPNDRFLDTLIRVKADRVRLTSHPVKSPDQPWRSTSKHSYYVEDLCLDTMVRKKKLYAE